MSDENIAIGHKAEESKQSVDKNVVIGSKSLLYIHQNGTGESLRVENHCLSRHKKDFKNDKPPVPPKPKKAWYKKSWSELFLLKSWYKKTWNELFGFKPSNKIWYKKTWTELFRYIRRK